MSSNLFPFIETRHPRRVVREGVAERLGTVNHTVNDAVYPADYDHTKVEGDEGFIPRQMRNIYWTPAQDRVFSTRSIELTPEDLPCIIVQGNEESVEPINKSGFDGGYRRTLTVTVEGLAEALDDVEDNLDLLALGVEGAMDGLVLADAESGMLELKSTEMDVDRDGEIPIGAVRLTYTCVYHSFHLGAELGSFDLDTQCIIPNGPQPPISKIILNTNFGTETYQHPEDF